LNSDKKSIGLLERKRRKKYEACDEIELKI
jgi:hypothetical protein